MRGAPRFRSPCFTAHSVPIAPASPIAVLSSAASLCRALEMNAASRGGLEVQAFV